MSKAGNELDDATVTAARRGDADAFAAIWLRYHGCIYAHVWRTMGATSDWDEAEELTQAAFVKAWRGIPAVKSDRLDLQSWLYRIATNTCLDVLRRRQRIRMVPWEGPSHDHLLMSGPPDDPERIALSDEARTTVQRVLMAMSPRHRAALVLREYQGLDCYQVGEVMGLSRTAVKSMLFRARDEFRRVYRDVTGEDGATAWKRGAA